MIEGVRMKTKTMKKSLCVLLSIIVMMSVFAAAFPATVSAADPVPTAGGSGYITSDYVNLRSGAGTNYSLVTQMRINTKVTFTDGKLYNSEWYHIKELATNKTGYVRRDLVKANAVTKVLKLSNTYNTIYVGTQLAITAYDAPSVTWSSSNSLVASVDSNGIVTANGPGTAVITASASGLAGSCTVNVKNGTPVNLSKSSQLAYVGNSFTLTSTTAGVNWYTSNPNVVTVTNGVVKAVSKGYATVSAYTSTGSATCLVQVTDPPANLIKLSNTYNTIYTGSQLAITAYDVSNVTWTSSNTNVATVDANGIVSAKAAGSATITAKSGSKSGTCKVNVKNGNLVNISKSSQTAYLGNSFTLTSTTAGVQWFSNNTNIATVSNGVVKAVGKGYVTITAYTSNGGSTCLVHVTDPPDPSKVVKLSNTNNTIYVGTQLAITAYNVTSVTWSSSNTNVATVDYRGVVTAKAAGCYDLRQVWRQDRNM